MIAKSWITGVVLICSFVLFCYAAELRVVYPQRVVSLDPHGPGAAERIVQIISRHIFDALVDMQPDTSIVPALATSWERINDTTWRFYLRKNVRFHNGEDFDAGSVKRSIERIRELGSPLAPLFAPIVRTEIVDKYTLDIITQVPYGPLLKNLFFLKIVPAKASQEENFKMRPVGTGPFVLDVWETNVKVVLKANPHYWLDGVPKVEKLIFYDIPEPAAAVTALLNGEVDVVVGIPPEEVNVLLEKGFIVQTEEKTVQMKYLWVNCRGPLANAYVQEALWYALDISAIVETVFKDIGDTPTSILAKGVWGYTPLPPIPYDPIRAKELLALGGYPQGFAVDLKFNVHDLRVMELAQLIQSYLSDVGITVKLVPQERAAWLEDFLPPKLNWDLTICNAGALTGDPDYSLNRLLHSTARRTLCADPELDFLLDRLRTTVDPSQREGVLKEVLNKLWGRGPWIPVLEQKMLNAWAPYVTGYVPPANELADFRFVSIKK